jgi:hypothetical protein
MVYKQGSMDGMVYKQGSMDGTIQKQGLTYETQVYDSARDFIGTHTIQLAALAATSSTSTPTPNGSIPPLSMPS